MILSRCSPVTLAFLILGASLPAQGAPRGEGTRLPPGADRVPTLVVFLTIDQFRGDYLDRWKPQLTGGLGRLMRGGAWFTNAFQDHATTETAPGHASTMSGRFPSHTGIVRNSAGVFDPQAPVIGDASEAASPFRFRGGTLIDWLRVKDPRSRALSISRKDRAAILPLGRAEQNVYWYDIPTGNFSTSTYYADTLPTWLQQFNARHLAAQYAGKSWTTLLDASAYPEPDSVPEEQGQYLFPHVMPSDPAQAVQVLPAFPFMDELTLEAALAGVRALRLGAGPSTDVLAVSLSSTDAVGHRYGPDSRELHDQVLRVDRMLGAFLDSLFAMRDSTRIVIALTGDHGVAPLPELTAERTHAPTYRVDLTALSQKYARALAARGLPAGAFGFEDAMLFVDRAAFARARIDVDSVVRAFAAEAKAVPGVARADRVTSLAADSAKDAVARRWMHSLPPDYPVELVVTLKPYSVWGSYAPGIHGSPNDYDAWVPVLFWGAPFKPGRYGEFARTVDMAPTLAWVVATVPTDRLDGHVLWDALR